MTKALYNVPDGADFQTQAIASGFKGLFYQHDNVELFARGVRAILDGEVWVSRDLLIDIAMNRAAGRDPMAVERPLLTKREMEIIALITTGATNEEVATRLFISTHTVKTHLYNSFKKMGVPNRLQAALWAAKHL
jgi:DNA-binding NarL/FixJ family response regulator